MKGSLVLICMFLAGCAMVRVPNPPHSAVDRERLSITDEITFVPSGVVSSEGAAQIAREYFHMFFGDCGGIGAPEERGGVWAFRTAVGYGGTRGKDILVAKSGRCVFVQGGAAVFWRDGRWRYDRTRFPSFFDIDLPSFPPTRG